MSPKTECRHVLSGRRQERKRITASDLRLGSVLRKILLLGSEGESSENAKVSGTIERSLGSEVEIKYSRERATLIRARNAEGLRSSVLCIFLSASRKRTNPVNHNPCLQLGLRSLEPMTPWAIFHFSHLSFSYFFFPFWWN